MRALLTATLLCLMPLGCVVDPLPTPGTAADFKGDEGQGTNRGGTPPDNATDAADAAVNTPDDATPTDDTSGGGSGTDGGDVVESEGDGA